MLQKQITMHDNNISNLQPRVHTIEGRLKQQDKRMDLMHEKVQLHREDIEELTKSKVDKSEDTKLRRQTKKQMFKIEVEHDTLQNSQISLESYVEKYLPLKIQHQMAETLNESLDKKTRVRFQEYNHAMAEALREEIIKDTGHPKLKAKCLDLISRLRIESNVLNSTKTSREFRRTETRIERPPKEYDEDGKEILSLDEAGQIRVSHGVEEMEEMVNQGLLKKVPMKHNSGIVSNDMISE